MEIITGYLLAVIGIVFLGVLIDVVMPSGAMNKFIKGIFGVFIMFSVLKPLSNLENIKIDVDNIINSSQSVIVDKDFIEATSKKVVESYEDILSAKLADGGFMNVYVKISYEMEDCSIAIKKVSVYLENLVINTNMPHINKYEEMKTIIENYLKIDGEIIMFYG